MAIPKSKRTTTPLSVLVEADTIACYTIQICTDERRFPKRYRWCLTQHIIDAAVQAKMHIAKANSVYVNDRNSATLRRTYQQNAIADIAALSAAMDTAFKLFSGLRYIDTSDKQKKCINIATWTAQLDKVKSLLLAWKKSDTEKYKKYTDMG